MSEERSVLDLLLSGKLRNVETQPETADVEIPRLTAQLGEKVVFTVRALTYDQVAELRGNPQLDAEIVLAATVQPDFKNRELAVKLGVLAPGEDWGAHGKMPIDAISALLLPGDIDELSREVQRISGYLQKMTKTVKKKLKDGDDPELCLLFYLFHEHGMTPGQFYALPPGERVLLSAFAEREIELRTERD